MLFAALVPDGGERLGALPAPLPVPGSRDFARILARIGRGLRGMVPADSEAAAGLRDLGIAEPARWTLADVARAALLTAAFPAPQDDDADKVAELYRTADNDERASLLRALSLLPAPSRFIATAVEACRSSVQTTFDAVACGNTFPGDYFPEPAFNQMVLKAVFTGAPVTAIAGLRDRLTPGLLRMAADCRSERAAAGRPIPDDLTLLLSLPAASVTPFPTES